MAGWIAPTEARHPRPAPRLSLRRISLGKAIWPTVGSSERPMQEPPPPSLLERDGRETIAYRAMAGSTPGVMFCGGFMSDMTGTKATALEAHCAAASAGPSCASTMPGHGESGGAFRDGTIGGWRDDALAVLDRVASSPQVLVGSSMGGWIVLLLALARPERVAGPRRRRGGTRFHRRTSSGPRSTTKGGGRSPRPAKS